MALLEEKTALKLCTRLSAGGILNICSNSGTKSHEGLDQIFLVTNPTARTSEGISSLNFHSRVWERKRSKRLCNDIFLTFTFIPNSP